MKLLGFLLLTVGFLGGAYFLTGAGGTVIGFGFAVFFVIALAGVFVLRVSTRKRHGAMEKVSSEVKVAEQSLLQLAEGVAELTERRETINVYELRHEIDRRFGESLEQFVRARESIAIAYGLPAYAGVMSHFAAGERYLNRVWSCSVDGYVDEAHAYLFKAQDQFVEGNIKLRDLTRFQSMPNGVKRDENTN